MRVNWKEENIIEVLNYLLANDKKFINHKRNNKTDDFFKIMSRQLQIQDHGAIRSLIKNLGTEFRNILIMSYRDMRTFTEMMRTLGYPRLISMENFRSPNFPLVAEILQWLIRRYDPSADLPLEIDTEQDRVIFIKTSAQLMVTEAHVRLNTKKLYQADGYAVKELVKVTSLLYTAMKNDPAAEESENSTEADEVLSSVSGKLNDLKLARKLATEITSRGAALYDLVGRETDLREHRLTALNRQHNLDQAETGLRGAREGLAREMERIIGQLGNIAADEANLEAKVEKKRQELGRNQKRLSTLQAVRPAYFDEFERMEEELAVVYASYLYRFRNLATLESQYETSSRQEHELDEDVDSTLRKKAHESAATAYRTGGGQDQERGPRLDLDNDDPDVSSASSIDDDDDDLMEPRPTFNPVGMGAGERGGRPEAPVGRNFGAMDGEEESEDEDDDDSDELDDDSDLDLDEGDSEEEDDDSALKPSLRPSGAGKRSKPVRQARTTGDDSDNDF